MATKRITIPVGSGDADRFIMLTFRQDEHGNWVCNMGTEMMCDLQKGYDIPPNSRVEVLDVD